MEPRKVSSISERGISKEGRKGGGEEGISDFGFSIGD